jgi:hypothetical protein
MHQIFNINREKLQGLYDLVLYTTVSVKIKIGLAFDYF